MTLKAANIIDAIQRKVIEIARTLDCDASDVGPEEILPATGVIDSAGLMELIAWFESAFDLRIPTEDFTIDNLGSMALMSQYLLRRKGLL